MPDRAAIRIGAECRHCPLAESQCGPVFAQRRSPRFVVVQDHPSKKDIRTGAAYNDDAGKLIRDAAPSATLTYAQMCGAPDGYRAIDDWIKDHRVENKARPPLIKCQKRLAIELDRAEAIVTIGALAYSSVAKIFGVRIGDKKSRADRTTLSKLRVQRGHPFRLPNGAILMSDPSLYVALTSERKMVHVILDDVRRMARLVRTRSW